MTFWDSSAVIHLLVDQGKSAMVLKYLEANPDMLVWWGTPSECAAALGRLEREEALTPATVSAAITKLRELRQRWTEVLPCEEVREMSLTLPRIHDLRAGDALQLAAALVGVNHQPAGKEFLAFDKRLLLAAEREGFTTTDGDWAGKAKDETPQ